jgi:DNA-binding winged helix-turn-helix (wHTH) protein
MQETFGAATPDSASRFGRFVLLRTQRRLLRDGVPVELEDRVFDLIQLLLDHRERALDRREVIAALWGRRPVSDATLRQLLYKARRALDDDGEQQAVIRTLHGRSLQWVMPVERVEDAAGPQSPAAESASSGAESAAREDSSKQPAAARRQPIVRPRLLWAGGAALVVSVALLTVFAQRAGAPAAPALPRLAIEPIDNATGNAELDWVRNGLPGLLGSLVGDGGGLDVVNTLQVAQAWEYKPQQGRDREQQLRFVTGADVVVSGRLGRLADRLYELRLHLQPERGAGTDISVAGEQPGLLAADAVRRIRAQLGLTGPARPAGNKLPRDAFLAEAYARGMDLLARGKVADAIAFFKLCVAQAPGFLPARLQLGIAQRTAEVAGSRGTLETLLTLARERNDPQWAARALLALADDARMNSSNAEALADLRQALPYAQRAHDVETTIRIHLMSAIAAHTLRDNALSARELATGEALMAGHPGLRREQELLDNARDFIALENGDVKGALDAARASLAMYEADGDDRASVVALGNIAVALMAAHRNAEAITATARALQIAHSAHYELLELTDAGNLALSLLNAGLPEAAVPLSDRQYALAQRQNSLQSQVLASVVRAGAQLQALDGAGALASLKRSEALPGWDALDPYVVLSQWLYEAMAAFTAEPGLLPDLQRRADTYVATHEVPPQLRSRAHIVDALAAAAAGRKRDALKSLQAAAALPPDGDDGDLEVRMAPLLIAIHDSDQAAAAIALKGYDAATTGDAALLRLYAQWMLQQGDRPAAQRAQAHLAALRKQGRDALTAAGMGAVLAAK